MAINATIYSHTDHITWSTRFDTLEAARQEIASRGFSFRRHFDTPKGQGETWLSPTTATEVGSRAVIKHV